MVLPILALLAADSTRLQTGTKWFGQEILHFVDKESEIDETHVFKVAFRIVGKDDQLWITEKRATLLSSKFGDTEIPPPPYSDPSITKQWLSPAGFLLDEDPYDVGNFNLGRLISYWLPDNNPDEWTADLSTTVSHSTDRSKASFKLLKRSGGLSEYSIAYNPVNNPIGLSASGKMWFDVATGRLIQAKIDAQSTQLPGSHEKANVTLTYTDSAK